MSKPFLPLLVATPVALISLPVSFPSIPSNDVKLIPTGVSPFSSLLNNTAASATWKPPLKISILPSTRTVSPTSAPIGACAL